MDQLRDNQGCFVCGRNNPVGLSVAFEINTAARSISAVFIPSDRHQGYEGIVHGGILSSLLDEAMAKLTFSLGIPALTAEMTVKFKAPVTPGEEIIVYCRSGARSATAVRQLQAAGVERAWSLAGGILRWEAEREW